MKVKLHMTIFLTSALKEISISFTLWPLYPRHPLDTRLQMIESDSREEVVAYYSRIHLKKVRRNTNT
jgi:hypothetical protein